MYISCDGQAGHGENRATVNPDIKAVKVASGKDSTEMKEQTENEEHGAEVGELGTRRLPSLGGKG
jgi:hypothetical protein